MLKVYVHGGVSGLGKTEPPSLAHAINAAATATNALDAVEMAVRSLEDDPALNAGFGSVLNRAGHLEMDAGIADGSTGRIGAVASVQVRNPISLARKVLEDTPHVLLVDRGAMALAEGWDLLPDTSPEQRQRWERAIAEDAFERTGFGSPEHVDTVGAVALDTEGRLAAGSSTGGVFGKLAGRVGDAPIFGAGFYASDRCAVVGTGVGELFLESLACLRTGELIEDGRDPQRACASVVGFLGGRSPLAVGILALASDGTVGSAYRGGSLAVEGPQGVLSPVALP